MKKLVVLIMTVILFVGCGSDYDVEKGTPVAIIEFEDGNKVVIELAPDKAPNTVNSFIELADDGFYDGLIFHRIIKDFMIQGGDPQGTGMGGPGYTIPGEMSNNGFSDNDLKNEEGTIAMARSQMYDSAGSQFFINVNDNSFLDGEYAVFGKVIEGYEYVEEYSKVRTDGNNLPLEEIKIKTITIELNGYDPAEVEKYSE